MPDLPKLTCTDSDCDRDLHCFRPTSWVNPDPAPRCRDCGADLIAWEQLHQRQISNADLLFSQLPKELIRHHFWHMDIPESMIRKTKRYRPEVIADRTEKAIRSHVGEAADDWDGQQTPMEHADNAQIYFCGMHATACCCRKCMQYWHGIPADRPLTEAEITYFAALVWKYVCIRIGWSEHHDLLLGP